MRQPSTLSNPRLCAAMAAAAMVLTLLGARGHNPRTLPVQRSRMVDYASMYFHAEYIHRQLLY